MRRQQVKFRSNFETSQHNGVGAPEPANNLPGQYHNDRQNTLTNALLNPFQLRGPCEYSSRRKLLMKL